MSYYAIFFCRVFNGQTAFIFYSFALGFAIPLIMILTFYVLVIIKLKTVGPKNKSKEKKRVITRGRCWTGALKQTLEPIGSLVLVFLDSEI